MTQEQKLDAILLNTQILKENDFKIWQQLQPAIMDIGNIAEIVHQLVKENQELKSQLLAIKRKLE